MMLARSGVSFIRLIDFDYVTLSSLNRHATATLEDVGTAKVKLPVNECRQKTLILIVFLPKMTLLSAGIEVLHNSEYTLLYSLLQAKK